MNVRTKIVYFILGFLAFSTISRYIIEDIFHMKYYFIEIFFIPFILIHYNNIYYLLKTALKRHFFTIFIILSFFFVGFINGILTTGETMQVVTLSRSPIYLIILIVCFSEVRKFDIRYLYFISLGAIVGEIIFIALIAESANYYLTVYGIVPINIVALAILILVPIINKDYLVELFSIILGIIVCMISGFRINILVLIVSITTGVIWFSLNFILTRKSKKQITKYLVYFSIFVLFSLFIVYNLESIFSNVQSLFNLDFHAVERVSKRLVYLIELDFDQSRDVARISKFSLMLSEFYDNIIPLGAIGRTQYGDLGNNMDVPLTFLYNLFGSITTVFIVTIFFIKGSTQLVRSVDCRINKYSQLSGVLFTTFLVLIVLNGRFMFITYETILSGIVFGGWFNKNKGDGKCA